MIRHATIHGQIVHGRSLRTGNTALVSIPEGEPESLHDPLAVDPVELASVLDGASLALFSLPPNGETTVNESFEILLSGADLDLNVFVLTPEQLERASLMEVAVPMGATVLVNVPGDGSLVFSNFAMVLRDTTPSLVLFNAPSATSVRIFAFGMMGSLLAPRAVVDFDNGQMRGTMMVRSFPGDRLTDGQPDGQLNCSPFRGTLCPPGTPTFVK
jgi:choice-of-anchor A domain-containing protein